MATWRYVDDTAITEVVPRGAQSDIQVQLVPSRTGHLSNAYN